MKKLTLEELVKAAKGKRKGMLDFVSCTLIEAKRTGDYQTTTGLLNIIANNGYAPNLSYNWPYRLLL